MNWLTKHAIENARLHLVAAALLSAVMIALAAVPTLWPQSVSFLHPLHVDTDPENMLAEDTPVRVLHNDMKKAFSLNDLIVVGVVQESHDAGVFNVQTLADVYALADYAKELHWEEDGVEHGVLSVDVIAPSTMDNIEQDGLGSVRFEYLMPEPPKTPEAAVAVRDRAQKLPMLNDTLVSRDGRALALYVPIATKSDSYRVATSLREKIDTFSGGADYHITGLPIAQDQFGVEMFKQMAISAPVAMMLIVFLMWLFFRRIRLILSPMVVAMVSVIGAMGLLIVTGNTVHIMSSMIPIFIMPIAVLDAVHILSDFYDRYPKYRDKKQTLSEVMDELWKPMLFTSLTTFAGFVTLVFTPIPPVQVFGVFVGIGVLFAWFFTVTLIPAYIMVMPEKSLEGFGGSHGDEDSSPLTALGRFSYARRHAVVGAFLVILGIAGYGISEIVINDNPVEWFKESHAIRVADRELNERFGGTYMAYLTLAPESEEGLPQLLERLRSELTNIGTPPAQSLADRAAASVKTAKDPVEFFESLSTFGAEKRDATEDDAEWEAWDNALLGVERVKQSGDVFKRPEMLAYMEKLQAHLLDTGRVGKSTALPDVVKTVHRELFLGEEQAYRIPDSSQAVAQTLLTFQNSHRPGDLFKLVTPDYRRANVWVQLTSGDNQDMAAVVDAVDQFVATNAPPVPLAHDWFGLTYINVVWQQQMVAGMAKALMGGFVSVLILMMVLLRSFGWGLLSMVPLSVTITAIYGVIGLIGKDYDMPIAVLSSLSLGLAVDYAIHFTARARQIYEGTGDWESTLEKMFGEPARAIYRNIIVVGAGFIPLVLAPLIPYRTVGVFISAILLTAGVATLVGLPALITLFRRVLFPERSPS